VPLIYMVQWKWGLFICSHVIHSLSCWAMQFPHRLAEQYSQSNSSPWRISFRHSPHSMVPLMS